MDSRTILYETFPKYGLPVFVVMALILNIFSYFLKSADKDSSLFTFYYVFNTMNLILGVVLIGVVIMGQLVNKEYTYFGVSGGSAGINYDYQFPFQAQTQF